MFGNLESTLNHLNNFLIQSYGFSIFIDSFSPSIIIPSDQEYIFVLSILYLVFLVHLPIRFGKIFAKKYAAKKSIMSEFTEANNEASNLRQKLKNNIAKAKLHNQLGKSTNNQKLQELAIAEICTNYILNFIIWVSRKIIFLTTLLEIIEIIIFKILFIEKLIRFSINFLTKKSSIEEVEVTKGPGTNLITVDISTTEKKIISGILKDYHSTESNALGYFAIEKAYKRETIHRSKHYVKNLIDYIDSETFNSPVLIPGNTVVVPIEKIIDFNLFKTKKEAHFKISVHVIDNKSTNSSQNLDADDCFFIKEDLAKKIKAYNSGRISYVKMMFFYPQEYAKDIEMIINDLIKAYEFITLPEYIEYTDEKLVQLKLKEFYSFLERNQYGIDCPYFIIRDKNINRITKSSIDF